MKKFERVQKVKRKKMTNLSVNLNSNWYYILVVIIFSFEGIAQKTLQKEWDAGAIDTLSIVSNAIYSIEIKSVETNTISISTNIEGENFESVMVNAITTGSILNISTGFRPHYIPENDKLAAHKILSIEMHIIIPENITVVVYSELASVTAYGPYNYFEVALGGGRCYLYDFIGNARLFTTTGEIVVHTYPGIRGKANSLKGRVINNLGETGKFYIEAESALGEITLLQQ